MDDAENVSIYQSRWHETRIPPEARAFQNFTMTEPGRDESESLVIMRMKMIKSEPFAAGVFIGGMDGVVEVGPQGALFVVQDFL